MGLFGRKGAERKMKKAKLILKNGRVFPGHLFGEAGAMGEVVFTTGMSGYQESISDPSFCGQIVVLTYPLIGNYGVNHLRNQGAKVSLRAVIAGEVCNTPSHWESEENLFTYLEKEKVSLLSGIDTRALTREIRSLGAMRGIIVSEETTVEEALKRLDDTSDELHPVYQVTCQETYRISQEGPKVAVMDFGIKRAILDSMKKMGFDLTVYPATTKAEEILAGCPDGVLLSNGPGDPMLLRAEVQEVQKLIGKLPIFGICMGHQLLALASGASTYKMKFGHRGSNHPVKNLKNGQVKITAQNHGYALDAETLSSDWEVTHTSVNDGTVEGMRHKVLPIFSVQYHPEAYAGPLDNQYLFGEFLEMIERGKNQ